jgi:hypothetical protein
MPLYIPTSDRIGAFSPHLIAQFCIRPKTPGALDISRKTFFLDPAELCYQDISLTAPEFAESKKLRGRKHTLKGVRLSAASWLGASVRIAVSWPLQNRGMDRAVLPRRNAFPALVRGTTRRHTHA